MGGSRYDYPNIGMHDKNKSRVRGVDSFKIGRCAIVLVIGIG